MKLFPALSYKISCIYAVWFLPIPKTTRQHQLTFLFFSCYFLFSVLFSGAGPDLGWRMGWDFTRITFLLYSCKKM